MFSKLWFLLKTIHYDQRGGTGTAVATGDTITAAKMNLKLEEILDADLVHDTGHWTVGVDGAGQDIIYYTNTEGRVMTWDPSDDSLELDDDVILAFGDADDVEIKWDGAKLSIIPLTDDTGYIVIGDATHSFDFKWLGSDGDHYVLFDLGDSKVVLEAIDLYLGDADLLVFGDGADVVIQWTGALLTITPATSSVIAMVGDISLTIASRTGGSAADLGVVEEGLLVAAQYTDAAALANATDLVGCAAIFDLKLGRAITLASGGGYGFATIWANLEVDKAINATGAQSAGWFTLWADAAGGDAHIRGTSRLQVLDLAIVTGADFDASGDTKIYGLRIDSSVDTLATMDGEFAAIDIGKSSGCKDWTRGIDIANCTMGMYSQAPIQVGVDDTGYDVKFFGATTGTYVLWDESNETVDIVSKMAAATGTTSEDVLKITVTDASVISGNINRGLYVDYTSSGVKTGTAQVNCIAYDLTVSENCPDVMLQAGYLATIADKTIATLFGISLYFEDFGNAIANFAMLDLGYNSPHAPSGRNAFMRLRQHHTVQAESVVMLLEGNAAAGYFIKADVAANLIEAGDITDGKACTHGVRCKVGDTVFVLAGYED